MTDAPWLRLCPPFIGAATLFAGQRRGCGEDAEAGGGYKWIKDGGGTRKRERKSALVVKRKQLRETEKGGGGGEGQRNADSAEWDADGSKTPSLRFFPFFSLLFGFTK